MSEKIINIDRLSEYDEKIKQYISESTSDVTEETVAGWGFTKNTGDYTKPSTGIPKADLDAGVQTSLGKADTALQSFTETDPTVPAHVKSITEIDITNWNNKQSALSDVQLASANSGITAAKVSTYDEYATVINNKVDSSSINTANGVAGLDENGIIPSSILPSYVDDVLEYTSSSDFPSTGESGIIYVETSTNKTYRWSGSEYVAIGSDLALGETSSTAYAGDKGKATTDNLNTHTNDLTIHDKVWTGTRAEYDALPDTKLTDGVTYYLTDSEGMGGSVVNDAITSSSATWSSQKINAEIGNAVDGKVNSSDIVNNLTTGGNDKPLSAEMGKSLNTEIGTLKTSLNPLVNKNCNEQGITVEIGTFNGLRHYRKTIVITTNLTDGTHTLSAENFSGSQITAMYGVAQYDNGSGCIPLGQYTSSSFYAAVGFNSQKQPYYMLSTSNRVSRIYLNIEYFES